MLIAKASKENPQKLFSFPLGLPPEQIGRAWELYFGPDPTPKDDKCQMEEFELANILDEPQARPAI